MYDILSVHPNKYHQCVPIIVGWQCSSRIPHYQWLVWRFNDLPSQVLKLSAPSECCQALVGYWPARKERGQNDGCLVLGHNISIIAPHLGNLWHFINLKYCKQEAFIWSYNHYAYMHIHSIFWSNHVLRYCWGVFFISHGGLKSCFNIM